MVIKMEKQNIAVNTDFDLLEARQNELIQLQELITKEFDNIGDSTVPRITSIMFREVFLPMFANDETRKYPEVTLNMWIDRIAGNPFQKVFIVDEQNTIVGTVPPIYDREVIDPIDPKKEGRRDIEDTMQTVGMLKERSPHQAEKYFMNEMNNRIYLSSPQLRRLKHAHEWNLIYQYYGRPIRFPGVEEKIAEIESEKVDTVENKKSIPTTDEKQPNIPNATDLGADFELA